ncbi:hypothetical protein [Actinoalloteichus spitiensis]|nr:hypothetical protein [Actinoalloteichus spitiensis]
MGTSPDWRQPPRCPVRLVSSPLVEHRRPEGSRLREDRGAR